MGKKYIIQVESNPAYCGIGAGGVQFANGKAEIEECQLVNWYKEHEGYLVKEAEKPIDKMTVAELQEYAKEKGIDLGEAKSKAEILDVIKAAE